MHRYKNYLITAADSHLGKKLVSYLLQDKESRVMITTRNNKPEFKKTNRLSYCHPINLIKEHHLIRLKEKCSSFFNTQFNIINCSGYFPGYKSYKEVDIPTVKKVFESNVIAVYSTAHYLIPLMKERGGGHFIAFCSHTQSDCFPLMAAYNSAKSALGTLIKSIANECLKENIIANALALPTLDTDTERKLKPHGDFANWLEIDKLCKFIKSFIENSEPLVNGNVIHLYKYSYSFFNKSYFERIGIETKK